MIIFFLSRLTGSPLDLLLPIDAPEELRRSMAEELGLNRPYHEQFFTFMLDILRGNFGESIRYFGVSAIEIFFEHLPNSLSLIVPSFFVAYLFGVPLGVFAAVNRRGPIGKLCEIIGIFGVSIPVFWLAILLIYSFSVTLGVLPSARMGGPNHYVLPVFTLSFFLIAGIMRLIRSSMLAELDNEYAKLARIKGVTENSVVWKHCLRNSLIPAISYGGVYFARLISGTIVIETVFAWPGSGRLLYDSIMMRDYPVVQTVIILKSAMILVVTLVVDILYAYLDPRIRY
jgi:peptide/nickel transport system permease protein